MNYKEIIKKRTDQDYKILKEKNYDLYKYCIEMSNGICFNNKIENLNIGYEIEAALISLAVKILENNYV